MNKRYAEWLAEGAQFQQQIDSQRDIEARVGEFASAALERAPKIMKDAITDVFKQVNDELLDGTLNVVVQCRGEKSRGGRCEKFVKSLEHGGYCDMHRDQRRVCPPATAQGPVALEPSRGVDDIRRRLNLL